MEGHHGVNSLDPKTAEEINIAEGGLINRWLNCPELNCRQLVRGPIGLQSHMRMHRRNNEVAAAAAAAEGQQQQEGQQHVENEQGAANNYEIEENPGPNGGLLGAILAAAGFGPNGEIITVDMGKLLADFRNGLYQIHHTWLYYIKEITIRLINKACETVNEDQSFKSTMALMLFPGIVQRVQLHGKRGVTPIGMLKAIAASNNPSLYIIEQALHLQSIRKQRGTYEEKKITVEQERAKVEQLIKEGRLSAAGRKLGDIDRALKGIAPAEGLSQEQLDEMIRKLFPARDERDILPEEDEELAEPCLVITADQIRERGNKINKDGSAGISAWSPVLISKMTSQRNTPGYNAESPPEAIHVAMAKFANKMIAGEIGDRARRILTETRLVMIPKDEGTGKRPLQIDCCFIKFLTGTTTGDFVDVIQKEMGEYQLGGGTPSGTEIIGRILCRAYEEGMTITKLDASNAYGEVKLLSAYNELKQTYPKLLKLFRWKYGSERTVRNNKGEIVTLTGTGLGQGCPGSGPFFMVASRPLLIDIGKQLKESEDEVRSMGYEIKSGFRIAYLDDVFLINDPRVTMVNTPKLEQIYTAHNAKLNVSKSEIIGREAEDYGDIPEGWKVSTEGGMAVGVPFGTTTFRREKIMLKLRKEAPSTPALAILHPNTGMILLEKVISKKASYIINTASQSSDVMEEAKRFDKAIIGEVIRITQQPLTRVIQTQINLPQKFGGAGIMKTAGIEAEAAMIRGTHRTNSFILEKLSEQTQLLLKTQIFAEIVLGEYDNVIEETEIDASTHESMTGKTVSRIMWNGKMAVYKKISERLIQELGESEETRQHAATILSKSGSSMGAQYISSTIGRSSEVYFSKKQYVATLRQHLGGALTNSEPATRKRPQGGQMYETSKNKSESLSCVLNGSLRTNRHTAARDILYRLMKGAVPPGDYCEKEKVVGKIVTVNPGRPDSVTFVQTDIVWLDRAVKYVIDVSIVTPEAQSFIQYPYLSHIRQDAAAECGEKRKLLYYSKVNEVNGIADRIPAESVIPFVIESTGRLGPAAFSFLNKICGTQTFKRSRFISEIALLCARYTGKMLVASRERFDSELLYEG